jgi:hypothetical protein
MAHDRSDGHEETLAETEQRSPARDDTVRPTPQSPFTLASLLDLNEAELSQPLPRVAPTEERWEQLTLGVAAETGDAERSVIRSGSPTDANGAGQSLIPGLEVPGAVEVPVYLAGRALHDMLAESAPPDHADETGTDVESIDGEGEVETVRHVTPKHIATAPPKPRHPPALVSPVSGAVRRSMDPPVANFEKADSVQVLWPKPSTTAGAWAARMVCEQCGMLLTGGQCRTCRGDTAGRGPMRLLRRMVARLVRNEHRSVSTLATLVLVPGELTVAHLTGQTRRYAGTTIIAVLALVLFTVISMVGSLRPRPDRALGIGTEQTPEVIAGVRDRTPVDLARDEPPGLLRDLASTLSVVPVLWLPLASVLVLGLVALLLAPDLGDGEAATVFTTHAMSWFVLWWGVGVPVLLLLLKCVFESAAAPVGDGPLRYLAGGGVAGVPEGWNAARTIVISGEFHSLLLALGFTPWLAAAWRRTFATGRARSVVVALLISAIPLLLLTPFT